MNSPPEVKDVVDFAERLRYVLELKINKLRTIMQKSDNHYDGNDKDTSARMGSRPNTGYNS
jgi:hypothetical protein